MEVFSYARIYCGSAFILAIHITISYMVQIILDHVSTSSWDCVRYSKCMIRYVHSLGWWYFMTHEIVCIHFVIIFMHVFLALYTSWGLGWDLGLNKFGGNLPRERQAERRYRTSGRSTRNGAIILVFISIFSIVLAVSINSIMLFILSLFQLTQE